MRSPVNFLGFPVGLLRTWPGVLMLAWVGIWLSGCLSATPTLAPGPIPTETPTPQPTSTATPVPLGEVENPIVFGYIDAGSVEQPPAADRVIQQIAGQTGLAIRAESFSTYRQLLEAMEKTDVHLAWMPPLTYLYASQRGIAEVGLLSNHFGVYRYGVQFLVNASSGFQLYFDPLSGQNSADAATALRQFEGKRPCYVEPTSAAGYLVPAGLLARNGIRTAEPVFTQTHSGIVRTLYVQGVCDFGATFAISGDPRTSSAVLQDLPDALERIPVVWRSDPLIPNLALVYAAGMSEEMQQTLEQALIDLVKSDEGRSNLSLFADYEIEDLRVVDDSLYDPLRETLAALGVRYAELIGK
ncbi:hypothetical protein ANT_10910 [Anaerolinea thermophila UNI-1]|uniref:Phosphate/phosphite/phosphonate ABC transporter substrate-binding protein n=2 Tax=Anaerolinea thermophila TaxID=167964 RepID=E8N3W1_ANATU|nr:hypothetical protein ANT_10910 [Anaerolinea thermophila UNI-1]